MSVTNVAGHKLEAASVRTTIQEMKTTQHAPICAYIYDLQALTSHVRQCVQSLPEQSKLFYAIKANSDETILRTLAPLVHGFEVASLGEIIKVRAISKEIPILFGGPGKTEAELQGALEYGVQLIHVESIHELNKLNDLASHKGILVPVLLRVNLKGPLPQATLSMGGRPTQFGIDESLLPQVMERIRDFPHIEVQGFHFHSLSNHLDASQHVKLVQYYCRIAQQWSEQYGIPLRYVNAGGGIGVNYAHLEDQFDWFTFVRELGVLLESELESSTTLLFECGRYLTSSSGYYATEVLDIKSNHATNYAIVRGGTHHFRLPVSWQHSHPFEVIEVEVWPYSYERPQVIDSAITIAGQLCTPKDILAKDVVLPSLRVGDVLLFQYAGAYGWAISHHDFLSHPHPQHIYLN
ncbi:diaminopimelate decarboxylase [Paenibacillus shirakamiensis]|uniref:Diaminopimelate decarboxylase n=1 Tax=Paenibacillus shirakamiensis TaxID=1265935 RepID=A0ABS4JFR4_9BACL|nr:type III PLP-dependent enzyme [Paenibacillus shirakamiensis]MBP1999966.1 diaminopimelate decarboxylase [Paenibacillus shirakamiensis]